VEAPEQAACRKANCWASLWTARAIGYRRAAARYGIASADVSLAVVVQELVPAEASGILFTADPLTGARDQVMINAAWGLGEAIVGGQVTPDTVVVDKVSGAITTQEITEKDVMTVRTQSGTHEEPVPADRHKLRKLVGEADANVLLSGLNVGASQLASLGPLPDCLSQNSSREKVEQRDGHLQAELECRTSPSTRFSSQGDCRAVADSRHSEQSCTNIAVWSTGRQAPGPGRRPPARGPLAGPDSPTARERPALPPAVATAAPWSVPTSPTSRASPRNSATAAVRCYSPFSGLDDSPPRFSRSRLLSPLGALCRRNGS